MKILIPPIKIQGIKTKLIDFISSHTIVNCTHKRIEPFLGSWVVGFNLAPKYAIFADTNPHTINFYKGLNSQLYNHIDIKNFLKCEWMLLLEKGEAHYKFIRDRFNQEQNPLDFLFLNRACFNGMIRFNRKWWFNVPFCKKPNRFAPAYITKIVNQVKNLEHKMQKNQREFVCQDFRTTIKDAQNWDFIYCDPPYIWRHVDYFDSRNEQDEKDLHDLLLNSNSSFAVSTRHSNTFRSNTYLETLRNDCDIRTTQHFYHLWGKEKNRNPITEALILKKQILTSPISLSKT